MDILKKEIERKRKQLEDANLVGENKKYFKRGDLIAKHEEEYLKRHGLLKAQSAAAAGSSGSTGEGSGKVQNVSFDCMIILKPGRGC